MEAVQRNAVGVEVFAKERVFGLSEGSGESGELRGGKGGKGGKGRKGGMVDGS